MTETRQHKTLVGAVDEQVLAFTVGKDTLLDLALVEPDCLGTAAHVTMLSRLSLDGRRLVTAEACKAVIRELVAIIAAARRGEFAITLEDQDVHLAVERRLTEVLGDVGRRVHTARSRNDQAATDMRLLARDELLGLLEEGAALVRVLLDLARRHRLTPMVGRTHMQPGMPSSVGVWAAGHAESLLDDMALVMTAYDVNDRCPLGAGAGYGVPLPIDRALTADLLGFSAPLHSVVYAGNARGKCESVILSAMTQVMLSLSRLAEDLILFSTPEMPYFELPAALCTGSSMMPQKRNPDVLELVRAKASRVMSYHAAALSIVKSLPSGYHRDLQEIKEPFLEGMWTTRECLAVLVRLVGDLGVNRDGLRDGFVPGVFATDRALELVAGGMPFREAYDRVKTELEALGTRDPAEAVRARTHLGAPGGLDLDGYKARLAEVRSFARDEQRRINRALSLLLGVSYPELDGGEGTTR